MGAGAIVRGCGMRFSGGIYMVCGTSPFGKPLEHFLFCPPKLIDVDALQVPRRGVKLIEYDGVTHVLDWIGREGYSNTADFAEEARRMGLSRRLPKSTDFARLGPGSQMILLHDRAWIDTPDPYPPTSPQYPCPKGHETHVDESASQEVCLRLCWADVEGGKPVEQVAPADGRWVFREMPSFTYLARTRPAGPTPRYRVAAFGSFPITGLEVVKDPHGHSHLDAMERAQKSRLSLTLEDA